ncbi:hypothetical protein N431DRAFT_342854 [Stipitochalara longipes BDJ]|nr:hypothetical protein N431DRAFT_342854 [Stipitochalara longipes BDJ]
MALYQTVDAESLAFHQGRAQKKYPEHDPESSLNKWVIENKTSGIFFFNEFKERCLWGEGECYHDHIQYAHDYSRRGPGVYQETVNARHFYIRRYKLNMKQIDRPKKNGNLFAHPSERGWQLPRTHKRHFLNFPQAPIRPSVIACNWGTKWNLPHLGLGKHWMQDCSFNIPSQTAWIRQQDQHGSYLEVRFVRQAPIDATILRISKRFYSSGINALYGNHFFFDVMDATLRECPPSLLPGGTVIRPWPYQKPDPDDWTTAINQTLPLIERRAPPEQLPGYIYYDHFLRFLNFIGPQNAARLKNLEFRGAVKRHWCEEKSCSYTVQCLLISMRFYIPFINKFCTGLEKLTLDAEEDSVHCRRWLTPEDISPATHEEAMVSFLENELRTISSLKELQILGSEDVSFVEPTITWLKDRTARQTRAALDQEAKRRLAESIRAQNLHCGFCGGEHVWAERHNLCNFCGGFGHFRKSCPALALKS